MSDYAQQQIKESGIAQVMVFLKQPGQAGAAAADLEKHFTQKETSPQAALANAMSFRAGGGSRAAKPKVPPPMRVFKNLGIMLGTVDQQGLAALRARKDQVQQVTAHGPTV